MSSVSGIYVISNTKNGKIYIGQSENISERCKQHRRALNRGNHENCHLQRAWNKYGGKAFKFKILEHCSIEQLDEREQYYLDIYMPRDICYNIATDVKASMRGRKKSPQSILKSVMGNTGQKRTSEQRARISASKKGVIHTIETRSRMSAAHKGKKFTPEHCANMGICKNKSYLVVSPSGERFEVIGLKEFCNLRGLNQGHLYDVAKGKRTHHKGWKCYRLEDKE